MQTQAETRRNPLPKDHAECYRPKVTATVFHFYKRSWVEMTAACTWGCWIFCQKTNKTKHTFIKAAWKPAIQKPRQHYVSILWPKGEQCSKRVEHFLWENDSCTHASLLPFCIFLSMFKWVFYLQTFFLSNIYWYVVFLWTLCVWNRYGLKWIPEGIHSHFALFGGLL